MDANCMSRSLGDRTSGAGPPALSSQGNVDLAEVPGSNVHNELLAPTFDASSSYAERRNSPQMRLWISTKNYI